MDRKALMSRFLLKEAIKPRAEKEYKEKRLWDAIKKAHKDVMTGARTGNIPTYCVANKNGANHTLKQLYDDIEQFIEKGKQLCSKDLIESLNKTNPEVEFGAVQKLVNMTLKYIIILNELEEGFSIQVNEKMCECPIDSIVLDKLYRYNQKKHLCWTKMKDIEYKEVQEEIGGCLKVKYPDQRLGNIWFDFLEWNF